MFTERLNPKTTVNVLEQKVPRIVIMDRAYNKMSNYVSQCPDEVGWLGSIHHARDNIYVLQDVYLFKQEVHATTTEINPEGLNEFGMEVLAEPDGMDIWNSIKLWGHSHVNMGVFASGQDDSQMKTFAEVGHDYFFRLIANKKKELKIDMYDYQHATVYLDIPWECMISTQEEELAAQIAALESQLAGVRMTAVEAIKEPIAAEMKEKVKKKVYATSGVTNWSNVVWVQPHWETQPDGTDKWIYGYNRAKTKEEIAADEEKKTAGRSSGLSSVTTNTTGNTVKVDNNNSSGTSIIPFPNMDDAITLDPKTMEEIMDMFTEDDLMQIGYCQSPDEVLAELRRQGFAAVHFTPKERAVLYKIGYAKLCEHYSAQGITTNP